MTTAIQVDGLDSLARVASMAHKSGLARVQSPEAAGVIIMTGLELGLTPMQALLGIHLVEGKPVIAADTLVAVVRRSRACKVWRTVESTAERCTIETLRDGDAEPVFRTWTLDDARRAGLLTKTIWQKYPRAMLRHRCAADLAREVYPDVVLGMYDPEELDADGLADAGEPIAAVVEQPARIPTLPAHSSPTMPVARPDDAQLHAAIGTPMRAPVIARPVETATISTDEESPIVAMHASIGMAETPGDAITRWRAMRADVDALDKTVAADLRTALVKRVMAVGHMTESGARTRIKAALAKADETDGDPPDGTTTPRKGRTKAANTTTTGNGASAASASTDGATACADAPAWAATVDATRAHLAEIAAVEHLSASVRKHAQHLTDDALSLYAVRYVELLRRDAPAMAMSHHRALATVRGWVAEVVVPDARRAA